jgi:cytochrome c oxidase subunit 2
MEQEPHQARRHATLVQRRAWLIPPLAFAALLSACDEPQSSLAPAGRDARVIAQLFWWMAGGSALVWLLVMVLWAYAARRAPDGREQRWARWWVIGGGAIVPTLSLTALLIHGLRLLPPLLAHGQNERGLGVHITGEQWWWRVRYELPNGGGFELANELRLPVQERTSLFLDARDVIHSFWIPSLAGKTDMIPGRQTRAALEPTRTGTFLGACAEYCGNAHAQMRLHVVVLEPRAFEEWLRLQRTPARPPPQGPATEGEQVFQKFGCAACHSVRGLNARGTAGPDLTHVGGRLGIGAAVLENDAASFARWLAHTDRLKPGVHMPSYPMLSRRELDVLSTFLDDLR